MTKPLCDKMGAAALERVIGKQTVLVEFDERDYEQFKQSYKDRRFSFFDDLKKLEYWTSARVMDFKCSDVFVDIAAQDCPFADWVRETYGCTAYRQDLNYLKSGVPWDICCDASDGLPFADGEVTKISMHNSIEHFEGDKDTKLIRELERVLAIGGKLLVVPFYFASEAYEIIDETQPIGGRYVRIYDAEMFKTRILDSVQKLSFTLNHMPGIAGKDQFYYLIAEKS